MIKELSTKETDEICGATVNTGPLSPSGVIAVISAEMMMLPPLMSMLMITQISDLVRYVLSPK